MQNDCEKIKIMDNCLTNPKCTVKNDKCVINCNKISLFDCYKNSTNDCKKQCLIKRIFGAMTINNGLS